MKRWTEAFQKMRAHTAKDSGAALMMAIFAVTMLMVIATEIMYETNVELAVSSQSVNQVKAHYAAQAGVEISLLRIFIFRKAAALVGDSPLKSMLDPIWQMPFAWPPIVPESISRVNKEEIADAVKESTMQGQYFATIEAESAKLDVNDLASPLQGIVDNTKRRIKDIFLGRIETDEKFSKKWQNYDFDRLINNMKDYVDEDKTSEDGGQESIKYSDMGKADAYPPNQPFKTIEEIHMVAEMPDELFDVLRPNITIYGSKGLNVNYAGKEIFRAMDPRQFTDERIAKIMERRSDANAGGPFKDDKDFLGFIQSQGIDDRWYKNEKGDPKVLLLFDAEYNFRIKSRGRSGKVEKEITAMVYDFDRVKSRLKELANKQSLANASPVPSPSPSPGPGGGNANTNANTADKNKVPNERPNIVYWNEI